MNIADKLTTIAEKQQIVYDKGIEQGRQAQYDEFWDEYQNYGQGRPFNFMFASGGWNDKTFKPKYSMKYASSANSMFSGSKITDLQAILERQSVTFNFSTCYSFANMLQDSTITHIGEVNTASATAISNIFNGATKLVTVDLLKLKTNGSQTFSNSFNNCTSLVDIKVEGAIGNNIDFRYSPLNKASIESIIQHLLGTAGKTVTLKKSAVDNAFETSEGAGDGSTSIEWINLISPMSNDYAGSWTITLI